MARCQVYNGQARKGVLFYCLYGIVALASVAILLELSLPPFNAAKRVRWERIGQEIR